MLSDALCWCSLVCWKKRSLGNGSQMSIVIDQEYNSRYKIFLFKPVKTNFTGFKNLFLVHSNFFMKFESRILIAEILWLKEKLIFELNFHGIVPIHGHLTLSYINESPSPDRFWIFQWCEMREYDWPPRFQSVQVSRDVCVFQIFSFLSIKQFFALLRRWKIEMKPWLKADRRLIYFIWRWYKVLKFQNVLMVLNIFIR